MKVLAVNMIKAVVGGYQPQHPAYYQIPGTSRIEFDRLKRDLNGFKNETTNQYQELKNEIADLRREMDELKKGQTTQE